MTGRVAACPTCGRPAALVPENRSRPFCCERCRLIDLGQWFSGAHAIPGQPADTAEDNPGGDGEGSPRLH